MKKVLVLEDDAQIVALYRAQFKRHRPDLEIAATDNPLEASLMLEEDPGSFVGGIIDFYLRTGSSLNSLGFIRHTRAEGHLLPLIATTSDTVMLGNMIKAGCTAESKEKMDAVALLITLIPAAE